MITRKYVCLVYEFAHITILSWKAFPRTLYSIFYNTYIITNEQNLKELGRSFSIFFLFSFYTVSLFLKDPYIFGKIFTSQIMFYSDKILLVHNTMLRN